MTRTDCILCGGCSDICPVGCIDITPIEQLTLSQSSRQKMAGSLPSSDISPERRFILIKYDDRCIRCGLCARRCPVGAMTMGKPENMDSLVDNRHDGFET